MSITNKAQSGTILIVDDALANLDILFQHLKQAGFKVLVAQNGKNAILQAERAYPDVILLDIMMPDLDGFETCQRLKQNEATQDIPVIFMTALTDVESKIKGFNVGAVDYVTKPLELREVLARVTTHVTMRHLYRTLQEQNMQLQRYSEQTRQDAEAKAILLREVNHRVKNNLSAIIGLLYVAEQRGLETEDKVNCKTIMHDLIERVQGLVIAHEMLSAAEWGPLPLSELSSRVIAPVLRALPPGKRILVNVCPSEARIVPKQVNKIALIINELITNTVKYALRERPMARVTVSIAAEGEAILIEFRDDGPGYPEEVLRHERQNIGLYLMQTIVSKDLRGQVTLHNDHGAVTTIRFNPLKE